MTIEQLFSELIQVALGTRICLSHTPSADEWDELYGMAKMQSLIGICFAGVQKLFEQQQTPDEMLYLTWMGMTDKIQQRNEVVNAQCVEVQQMIGKDGFRTFIMKGQGNAALYHDHLKLLRQSGDIDIYLEGGFEKVNEYVQRTCPTKDINELEIHYPCYPDTVVEIHFKPFVLDGPKDGILQRFFEDCKEENFNNHINLSKSSDSLTICAPTLKFNLVHQMVHIHHHLFYEGVGMRQLMDYYFVLKTFSSSLSKGESVENVKECVREVVSDLGLDKFASALMWLLGHVFGFPEEQMLWKPNNQDGRFLLNEIMLSGNFGKQDERQKGLYDSKWNSFWMVQMKTFRFWRFDHWAWFWSPIWRIKGKLFRLKIKNI